MNIGNISSNELWWRRRSKISATAAEIWKLKRTDSVKMYWTAHTKFIIEFSAEQRKEKQHMKSYYIQCGHVVNARRLCECVCVYICSRFARVQSPLFFFGSIKVQSLFCYEFIFVYTQVSRNRRKLRVSLHSFFFLSCCCCFFSFYLFLCRFSVSVGLFVWQFLWYLYGIQTGYCLCACNRSKSI